MFQDWDNFYLLVGSAAAALIGLLFVVATLTTNLESASANTGANVYMTPTVFHLAVVLVLSGLALVPRVAPLPAGLGTAAAALAGLVYAVVTGVRLHRGRVPETPHWSDFWWYGAAPTAIYLGLVLAAVGLTGGTAWTAPVLAALLMTLLLVGVRNAWDLVTYLAPRRNSQG